MIKKLLVIFFLFIIISVAGICLYFRNITNTGFDIRETVYIEINNKKDYADIIQQIQDKAKVEDLTNFERISSLLKYPSNIKSGRYAIDPDMNVLEAIRLLKSGRQIPVKFTFNNIRTKEDLADRIAAQLMLERNEIMTALSDPDICSNYGFTPETIVCMFIPNTYEVYWNIPVDNFLDRMSREYHIFWNTTRLKKAESTGLSPIEISILASIVEEECYYTDEYPIVAGLYLNRIRKNMLLQADPTVKYAVGDFGIQRVLNKHLAVDSPYNTYIYNGLTPGPIRIPSIKAIDGVLNFSLHNYIYMCAKEDFSQRHNFAVTHAEHARNSRKYQAALNKLRIYN